MGKGKLNIYTSYYAKMANRIKGDNDGYIQVSRSIFCPKLTPTGEKIDKLIDINLSVNFGMWSDLDHYIQDIDPDSFKSFMEYIYNIQNVLKLDDSDEDINLFLLCHENLESKYTKKDEEKYPNDPYVKAGEYKKCHRTLLANELNRLFNLHITEYKGD